LVLTAEADSALGDSLVNNLHESLVVVGIPAFNEEKTIENIVLSAQKHSHFVIVCDDGSTDLTGEIAKRLGAVVIRHEQNFGYGTALKSLFKRARVLNADVLVTLDSDGQHDPAEIPQIVKPIEDGIAEVVLGSRFIDRKGTADMPLYRQLGVKVITKLINGTGGKRVSDAQSGFRAYSKRAIERLGVISAKGMGASIELLQVIHKTGLSFCEVPISCKYSKTLGVKTSTENPIAHGVGLILSIIKFVIEDKPLQTLGIPGIASLISGIFFGIWMMSLYAESHAIQTYVALASVSFIMIGFFMISTSLTLYSIARLGNRINKN
jgi:glycosyltransferase involved in cell wall biosynthesis